MLEKLKLVENRFAELEKLIIQPDIISDQKKYIQLSKEYKDIKKIIDKGEIYKNLISNKSEALDIISNEKDEEMIEMAKMQLDEVEAVLPKTEEDLKGLFPKKYWNKLHLQIIYYGRGFCKARDCYGITCKICKSCYPNRKRPIKTKKA